ncbi:site-specific integrase [Algoriphagus marincola]|uniref:site-specific integrase n=1 Tax=Algoriphagus marincola TaxID=264027 RepID=UPI000408FAF9|nr:site-specific integrase [Algoriphagus marincola]
MRASVSCRIRFDRANKSGEASVYLQVIIESKRTTVPLKVSWPVGFFDNSRGKFLPRYRGDQLANDLNMEADKEMAKINEIFMFYRHSDMNLTIEQFQKEYRRYGAKKDFLVWAEQDVKDRYAAFKIANQTYRNDLSSLNKIRKFKSEIPFSLINKDFLESLQAWLTTKGGIRISSAWRVIKTLTTYARRADQAGISVNLESISKYTMPKYENRKTYLAPEELQALKKYYWKSSTPDHHVRILGHFLFSCITGLRFSDVQRVSWKNILGDMLVFVPFKTRRREKLVKIPLIEEHFRLIHNEKGKLFNTVTEQVTNRTLKDIAEICGIRKNLTTHVARHTFATESLRKGIGVEVVKELMGHEKIQTTLEYTHVDEARLREEMKKLK